ncbi:hypothetical protein ACO0LI_00755 [Undibacterium sp. Tian12W]
MQRYKSLLKVSIRLFVNGFFGYLLGVFAGAGAGNNNQGNYFNSILVPAWIGIFVTVVILSYLFAIIRRHKIAMAIPLVTIPLMFSVLFLTVN